tara:strand:- start:1737 stop:1928 length:192 start_codon:yes stop_codon:yes gene_type:complete
MRAGDLVKLKASIRRPNHAGDTLGLVVEYFESEGHLHASARVQWPMGEEIEFPHTLEVVNEAR